MICLLPNCCFLSETSRILEIYSGPDRAACPGRCRN